MISIGDVFCFCFLFCFLSLFLFLFLFWFWFLVFVFVCFVLFICLFISSLTWDTQLKTIQVASTLS